MALFHRDEGATEQIVAFRSAKVAYFRGAKGDDGDDGE
jgi:hypothetical protein